MVTSAACSIVARSVCLAACLPTGVTSPLVLVLRPAPHADPLVTSSLQATGAYTASGTWAASEAEAKYIEQMVDGDERWEALLAERQEWTNKPLQPPGLARSGGCLLRRAS
jgi:hypothetical protein